MTEEDDVANNEEGEEVELEEEAVFEVKQTQFFYLRVPGHY